MCCFLKGVTGQISNFFLPDLQELAKIANYFKT